MPEPQGPQPEEQRPAQPKPDEADNGEGLATLFKEMDEEDAAKETDAP